MSDRIPVPDDVTLAWVSVAHSARLASHILRGVGDPRPASNFAQINAIYSYEKASDWHRAYLAASLEHLLIWADIAAPLKFHPEHETVHTFRPAYTLARAATEAASQAVWMTAGDTAEECARRHLSLIRWDYEEQRKSVRDLNEKTRIKAADDLLLERAAGTFIEAQLSRPTQYTVLRAAAPAVDLEPDELERVWRAASGSAHGRVWPSVALQHVTPLVEYEPGQFRTVRVPDPDKMTEALEIAEKLVMHGVLRFADFSGFDIPTLVTEARTWLASVIPFREDADPAIVEKLKSRHQ